MYLKKFLNIFTAKLKNFFTHFSSQKIAGLALLLIIAAAIPLTQIVLHQRTNVEQHAATDCGPGYGACINAVGGKCPSGTSVGGDNSGNGYCSQGTNIDRLCCLPSNPPPTCSGTYYECSGNVQYAYSKCSDGSKKYTSSYTCPNPPGCNLNTGMCNAITCGGIYYKCTNNVQYTYEVCNDGSTKNTASKTCPNGCGTNGYCALPPTCSDKGTGWVCANATKPYCPSDYSLVLSNFSDVSCTSGTHSCCEPAPVCGDGTCESDQGETSSSCPTDCTTDTAGNQTGTSNSGTTGGSTSTTDNTGTSTGNTGTSTNGSTNTTNTGSTNSTNPNSPFTPTPTPSNQHTYLSLALQLMGIGKNGNLAPKHPTRMVHIQIYKKTDDPTQPNIGPLVELNNIRVIYDANKGYFLNTKIDLGTDLPTNEYQILVKTTGYLRKEITTNQQTNTFTLTSGQTTLLPAVQLIAGDVVPLYNKLDISDFYAIVDCYGDKANGATCAAGSQITDLNDDGVIDGVDLNIWLLGLQQLQTTNTNGFGDGVPGQ